MKLCYYDHKLRISGHHCRGVIAYTEIDLEAVPRNGILGNREFHACSFSRPFEEVFLE